MSLLNSFFVLDFAKIHFYRNCINESNKCIHLKVLAYWLSLAISTRLKWAERNESSNWKNRYIPTRKNWHWPQNQTSTVNLFPHLSVFILQVADLDEKCAPTGERVLWRSQFVSRAGEHSLTQRVQICTEYNYGIWRKVVVTGFWGEQMSSSRRQRTRNMNVTWTGRGEQNLASEHAALRRLNWWWVRESRRVCVFFSFAWLGERRTRFW